MSLLKNILAEASKVDEVGELVALFRTSQLPTLIVERSDDVRIYSRWIEAVSIRHIQNRCAGCEWKGQSATSL